MLNMKQGYFGALLDIVQDIINVPLAKTETII